MPKNEHAVALGSMGGARATEAQKNAARRNGKLGGRPRTCTNHAEARRAKPHGRSKHDPTREAAK